MKVGIVTGTITATVKDDTLEGQRILVVALCNPDGTRTGQESVALDTVQAGIGDRVLVLREGNSARAIIRNERLPAQEVVVAVVDHVATTEER